MPFLDKKFRIIGDYKYANGTVQYLDGVDGGRAREIHFEGYSMRVVGEFEVVPCDPDCKKPYFHQGECSQEEQLGSGG